MIPMKRVTALLLATSLALVLVAASSTRTIAQAPTAPAAACDQACLTKVMKDFLSATRFRQQAGEVPARGFVVQSVGPAPRVPHTSAKEAWSAADRTA